MEGVYHDVTTPSHIIATLLEANCPDLFKITLELEYVEPLSLVEASEEDLVSWKYLDCVLTILAERLRGTHDRKLIFVMRMTGWVMARGSLPHLLPWFYDEGLIHVHDGEDDVCNGNYHNAGDERACVGLAALEEYGYELDDGGEETGDEWSEGNE